ncbi:hypothetical protein Val02_58660 [Virgisporangium aliadipatigenens]|uniref:FXSXX-COOH protein n=1 Tax=Virgisporangium aliadipatigenens TaxID=741659 RepID=A0A8J3YSB9_9ACTN|nr:hypothetical protein Val02_58660 [Virgisporangium aliadipatigenens]
MEPSPNELETDLIDLTTLPISALRTFDEELLAPSVQRVLVQVQRPRNNIGTGPPGRAD